MPLYPDMADIGLRLLLCVLAGALIGLNRDAGGKPVGMRTTILVCLAAGLSMMEANLLLDVRGKTGASFAVLDLMRLPLGILSGIGFIGAGVIIQRHNGVRGITTAASLWFVTVDGLCFGGGQIGLGGAALLIAILVLALLKPVENSVPRDHVGRLRLDLRTSGLDEARLRQLAGPDLNLRFDKLSFEDNGHLRGLECEIRWRGPGKTVDAPDAVRRIMAMPDVATANWTLEDYR